MDSSGRATRQKYRGISAEQRRAERRERLVSAAVAVYGEAGFRNSTVKAVCEAAGLTERYFYESFPSASDLLIAAFRSVTTALQGCILEVSLAATEPGAERVETILRTWFNALRNDPASTRLFLIEIASLSSDVRLVLDAEMEKFVDLLEVSWGARSSGPGMVKLGIAGALLRLATAWVESDYHAEYDDLIAVALKFSSLAAPH